VHFCGELSWPKKERVGRLAGDLPEERMRGIGQLRYEGDEARNSGDGC
jgi:hypothetical protein